MSSILNLGKERQAIKKKRSKYVTWSDPDKNCEERKGGLEARVRGAVLQIMVRKVSKDVIIKKRHNFLNQQSIIWVSPYQSLSFAEECLPVTLGKSLRPPKEI